MDNVGSPETDRLLDDAWYRRSSWTRGDWLTPRRCAASPETAGPPDADLGSQRGSVSAAHSYDSSVATTEVAASARRSYVVVQDREHRRRVKPSQVTHLQWANDAGSSTVELGKRFQILTNRPTSIEVSSHVLDTGLC